MDMKPVTEESLDTFYLVARSLQHLFNDRSKMSRRCAFLASVGRQLVLVHYELSIPI